MFFSFSFYPTWFLPDTFKDISQSQIPIYSGGSIDVIDKSENPYLVQIAAVYTSYDLRDEVLRQIPEKNAILVGSKEYFNYILLKEYLDR